MSRQPTRTVFTEGALEEKRATALYEYFRDNIEWEEGIRSSRKGFTRLAKSIILDDYPEIEEILRELLPKGRAYSIYGVYLNYYQNGEMWTPNHSHAKTQQLIVSLGATRTLVVGKKEFKMSNGSSIIFGSTVHGVPREPDVRDGRISIATFMQSCEI